MKRTLLFTALALAVTSACAAEPAARARATASAQADAHAEGSATAVAGADAAAARVELSELRTQMQDISQRMAELSIELGDAGPRAYAFRYLGEPDRAIVGVVLAPDKAGVRISAVTPGSPAARVGLRDGDLITAIDRKPVDGSDAGLAQARERLSNLREGQDVSIEYRRGTTKGVVVCAAERRKAWTWPALMGMDAGHPLLPEDFHERIRDDVERAQRDAQHALRDKDRMRAEVDRARREFARVDMKQARAAMEKARHEMMRHAMPWWGLNLAPVNADLGRYFGADKGALVISADEDALPGLRAGDVITGVGGETVVRPEDALRALRDQPAGKEVPIRVLRERKTLALTLKAPEFKSIFTMPPMPPEPPAAKSAPMPPAPPTPPADL